MRRYHRNDNGFTMAEMLITVAIIVILCGFGFVAVIAHQRNLKRMEMDETAQEIFIAAQNHLTAAEANGQWDAFLKKTSGAASEAEAARGTWLQNGPTGYDKSTDKDASSRKFYSFTTESVEAVQKGAVSLILPEGSIDETLRGHHFYVEYDAVSGTVYGVFYTDADHAITAEDAANVSRTDANARRDYKDENGKRTIIGYYGGALGELKNSGDLYAPSVAVRNAESLVLYVVDKNYHRHVSAQGGAGTFQTQLKLTFEGETSKAAVEKTVDPAKVGSGTDSFSRSVLACDSAKEFSVIVPGRSADEGGVQKTESVKAKYYAIVLDSIVREDGHFADLFAGAASGENGGSAQFIPGEDIKITVTLHSNNGGEDVSQTVTVNSLFNSVKQEKNALGWETGKVIVTVSNPRHLENLSTEVSGVDFTQIKSGTTIDTVSVVRNLFWDEDAAAGKVAKDQNENETVTAFLPAIASATGMTSPFGYCADGSTSIAKDEIQVYPYQAGTGVGNTGENADENSGNSNGDGAKAGGSENAAAEIAKGACYGITNTAIKTFEGNNHMLAAFRFEGKQESALINRAAAVIKVSDLVIADSTSCVTGDIQTGSDHVTGAEVPTAALLIAKANSGYADNGSASVENVHIVWYPDGANGNGITTGNSKVEISPAATRTMVHSENGIASLLIGSIDADHKLPDEEGKTSQQGDLTRKFIIKNVTIQAGDFETKKTADIGVEGNIAAGMIGEIKSGTVMIGDSNDQTESWKTNIKLNGALTLNAVKGDGSAAGGLIGKVADTASAQDDALTLQKVYLEADTLTMNGRKDKNNSILGGLIGSVEGGKSVSLENADLIAKAVNGGIDEKDQNLNTGTIGGIIGSVTAGMNTTLKNIRFISAESRLGGKQTSGGVIGSLAFGEVSLESVNVLATNKNETPESEGHGQSAAKTFRDVTVAASDQASFAIKADHTASDSAAGGLIGSVAGQVSKLSITKSSVKTVSANTNADVNLTVAGTNIGGLIGACGATAVTIGGDAADEVILTVQGDFTLGQSGQTAGNAGGLIGRIGQNSSTGNNIAATVQNVPLTARTMHAYAAGDNNGNGTVGGFVGYVAAGSSNVTLSNCNLSANSIDLGERSGSNKKNKVKAAGGAVGKISVGTVSLDNLTVLTPKADQDAGEGADNHYIRVIADQGMAGGLVGVAENGTAQLIISHSAVSGSGTNDQIEAGGSTGGLVGDSKTGQMSITDSMASMYVQTDGITNVSDSSTGAGGLVGSASGTVTIQNSYSGGRTTGGKYADSSSGQGRYNVYLQKGAGAGGILGTYTGNSLTIQNAYSTSSVAVKKGSATSTSAADAGGLVGHVDQLNATNTYCIGRVYAVGEKEATQATPHYGAYAGKLGSITGSNNCYLDALKGAAYSAVGTLGDTVDTEAMKNSLTGKLSSADYYDNESPLRKEVPSNQKTYCFDSNLQSIAYPLKTVTSAPVRTLYDPNTGDKVTGESADGNQYAQIGDWEVPEKQSLDGAYGLIYYERIQGDDTFYYHGYMLASGDSAQDATYTEVSNDGTSDPFVHDKGKYVTEDGYLLLVRNDIADAEKELHFGFGNIEEGIKGAGHDFAKIANVNKYNLDKNLCNSLKDYCAYYVAFDPSNTENSYYYNPSNTDKFGAVLAIWDIPVWSTEKQPKAAFTYLPFFADTVQSADSGNLKSVAKASKGSGKAQAIIRSARQLQLLAKCENNNKTAYLNNDKQMIVEQQLDISFSADVQFSNPLQIDGVDAHQSPTFEKISYKSEFRSAKCGIKQDSYYELIGYRGPFAKQVQGIISSLQIKDMRALHFIESIQGKEARVQNVMIDDASLGDKNMPSQHGGFADTMDGGIIENCHINNAIIYGDGFIHQAGKTENIGTIENCSIVNAKISENGFIGINSVDIDECGLYSNKDLYEKEKPSNYSVENADNGEYDYLAIGQNTASQDDVSGFIGQQENSNISRCFVTGTVYGYNVSGFIDNFVSGKVDQCYSNVLINAHHDAFGFCRLINGNSGNTSLTKSHALGQIMALNNSYGCVGSVQNPVDIQECYTAFWRVEAKSWYPFYDPSSNKQKIQNDFYLTDSALFVENGELIDYSNQVRGLTYQQLCSLHIDGLNDRADTTTAYYQYIPNDTEHQTYPYPMPSEMTAYGDWSHADPDSYTLLYYEKVDGKYYFHGYTTENGENYTELKTSGANLENGLLVTTGKTVDEDGYLLIAGTNSSWSSFGRADNSGAVSSPVNNANTQILTQVSSDSELVQALGNLQGLTKKDTDKIYIFQPDQYLNYEDTAKNFASWQTLTQESEGVGIAIYSTKGMTPMAKFSFQPFFADTVKAPNVTSQGTSNTSEITFVSTRDGGQEHDYRIRSLRQLQALSDWDAGIWNKKTVADFNNLRSNFDKDNTKRCSYLSTSNENYAGGLKVRQDLDINVNGANINFDRLDGTYAGRTYSDRSVMLQNLKYDFADVVAPGGEVGSLVIDQANLQGTSSTKAKDGDIAHGGQREFVEYNYGTIQNITVQNSELGSAGLVYQNGDVPENVLTEVREEPRQGSTRRDMEPYIQGKGRACQYTTEITYQRSSNMHAGTITNCSVVNSSIKGAGFLWKNAGGNVTNSRVEGCKSITNDGFVAKNQAVFIQAPQWKKTYEYWYNRWNWTDRNTEQVSEETITNCKWPVEETSSDKITVAVDAIIENCQVIDCTVKGNGFVGENTVNTDGSVGTSSNNSSGAKATISNCQVYGTTNYSDMKIGSSSGTSGVNEAAGFVGSNGKGAEITDCSVTGQVNGLKDVAGFALTNAGTITGSYANTKITCGGQQGTTISGFVGTNTGTIDRSHSLGEESYQKSGAGDDNRAAGFVVNNQQAEGSDDSTVIKNSYAAIWKLTNLDGINYAPFGSIGSDADAGSYENCYAMRLSENDGYQGTYSAAGAPEGITYVSGEELKGKCGSDLGSAVEDGKTTAYQAELKNEKYPFPCGSAITNYGDWKLTDGAMPAARTITLDAGGKAVFSEDLVRSLSTEASVMSVSAEDTDAVSGDSNSSDVAGEASISEEERHKVQVELGEEEETLDLSELVPERKGWKLLGWLITSPSDLSASEKKTTVSDIVTKINKISDGDAETEESDADSASDDSEKEQTSGTDSSENAAEGSGETKDGQTEPNQTKTSGSSKAVYELETGTKSYHYAPDAVITVTEDMTLAAVWVPDDDTIAKAKDGTLRMDENGNVLDDDTDAASTGASGNSSGTGKSDQAGTMLTEDNTQTAGTAKTDNTAQTSGTAQTGNAAGTEDSAADGTTKSDPVDQGNTESSGTGETQDGAGTDQTSGNAGTGPAESGETGHGTSSQDAGSSEASTEAATYSTEDAEPVKDPGI